jgi:O-antigen/teichoic acid export membrane protein
VVNVNFKRLVSDVSVYGIGNILIRSIGFITIPIFTRIFVPAQYGQIDILVGLNSVLQTAIVLGSDSGYSFYFFKAESNHVRNATTTTMFIFRIFWGAFIITIAWIFLYFLSGPVLKIEVSKSIILFSLLNGYFSLLSSVILEALRLSFRPWLYTLLSFISVLSMNGLAIYFVTVFQGGVQGYFLGATIGFAFATVIGILLIRGQFTFSIRIDILKKILLYGIPLVPASFSLWVLNYTDRFLIIRYLGADHLGIYAIGAKIGAFIGVAVEVFRQAWWPLALSLEGKIEASRFYRTIGDLYVVIGSWSCIAFVYVSPWVTLLLAGPKYQVSYLITPYMAYSGVLFGFYMLGGLGIFFSKKTYLSAIFLFIGAACNIGLNIMLIPRLGLEGAAISTLLAQLIGNGVTIWAAERIYPIGFNRMGYAIVAIITILCIGCMSHLPVNFSKNIFFICGTMFTIFLVFSLLIFDKNRIALGLKSLVKTWN